VEEPIVHFAAIITAIAASLTAIGVIVKKIIMPFGKGLVAMGRTAHTLDQLADLAPKLEQVVKEFETGNGGESLVDRTKKMAETQTEVFSTVTQHISEDREQFAKIELHLSNIQQQLEEGLAP